MKQNKIIYTIAVLILIVSLFICTFASAAGSDFIYGDLNSDGCVNTIDGVLISREVAGGYNQTINKEAADLNCDSKINTIDVILMQRYLAGGYGITLPFVRCNHIMEEIPTKDGMESVAFWHCKACNGYFSDESGTEIVSGAYNLDPENYVHNSYNGDTIEFYQSLTSLKKDSYTLDNAVVYVNGIKIASDSAATTIENYAMDNSTKFTLLDIPVPGADTPDFKIDYIMIDSYVTAVVGEVLIEENEVTIYFKESTVEINHAKFNLEAVADYVFVDKYGVKVKYENIAVNDVLTIYAQTADFKDIETGVDFLKATVTRDVVSGQITRQYADTETYEMNGKEYGFAGTYANLDIGDNYTFYLNAFGDIAYYEKIASGINYGIVNKVWENSNGEKVVRLVDANGEIVTYEFYRTDEFWTWYESYDNVRRDEDFEDVYDQLIVTYKINQDNKIYKITPAKDLDNNFTVTTAEFSEKNLQVGAAKMSKSTKIIDFTQAATIWSDSIVNKVFAVTPDSFIDGEEYTVIYGGSQFTDGTYPFVVVLYSLYGVGPKDQFAVVKSIGEAVNETDGITYSSAVIFDGVEEKEVYFEFEADGEVAVGDVIMYKVNHKGLVEYDQFYVLYNGNNSINLADVENAVANGIIKSWDYSIPWAQDRYGNGEKQAQLGYGVIVGKTTISNITVATVVTEDGKKISKATSFVDFDMARDANIYEFDQGIGRGDKMSVGSIAALAPTKLDDIYKANGDYEWGNAGVTAAKTVFFKTYENEITDIVVVIPKD